MRAGGFGLLAALGSRVCSHGRPVIGGVALVTAEILAGRYLVGRDDVYGLGCSYDGKGVSSPVVVWADVVGSRHGCAVVLDDRWLVITDEIQLWWKIFRVDDVYRRRCADNGNRGAVRVCHWAGKGRIDAEEGKDEGAGKPWPMKSRHLD